MNAKYSTNPGMFQYNPSRDHLRAFYSALTILLFSLSSSVALAQGNAEPRIETMKVTDQLHVMFGIGAIAGNVGVSIGEDGVLIVDDQSPVMVPLIQDAIRSMGGNDIDFVINTHWHFDHADGNKVLGAEGAWIVAVKLPAHAASRSEYQSCKPDHSAAGVSTCRLAGDYF